MSIKTKAIEALRRGPNGVLRAPAWLRERMRRIRELPPPTLEEVRLSFEAKSKDAVQLELEEKIRKGEPIR